MFQRDCTAGNSQLASGEWTTKVGELSDEWASMPEVDKIDYIVRAADETSRRNECVSTPLPASGSRGWRATEQYKKEAQEFGKAFLKKTSCARLQHNEAQAKAADFSEFGVGISSHDCALDLGFIDMETSDQGILRFCDKVLQGKAEARDAEGIEKMENQPDTKTCHELYGMCFSAPHRELSHKYMKSVHRLLSTSNGKFRVGCLFRLIFPEFSDIYFLGPCMKKPQMQVFLSANDEWWPKVTIIPMDKHLPTMSLSVQCFQALLCRAGAAPPESIKIEILQYRIEPTEPLLHVYVNEGDQIEYQLNSKAPPKRRHRRGRIGLGLTMPKKEGSKQPARRSISSVIQSMASRRRQVDEKKPKQPGASEHDLRNQLDSDQVDSGSESHSDASCSSSDSAEGNIETPAEIPVKTPIQKKEERECISLLELDSDLRPVLPAPKSVPKPRVKTQCHGHVGLIDIDVQKGGRRAVCPSCGGKFSPGDVRFVHAFDVYKWQAFVHPDCAIVYLRTRALDHMEQVVSFLNAKKVDTSLSEPCRRAAAKLNSEVHAIFNGPQSSSSSSSSSHISHS